MMLAAVVASSGVTSSSSPGLARPVGSVVPTGASKSPASDVQSWYDAGLRLGAAGDAVAQVAPTASDSYRPEGLSTRPAYVWNPTGLKAGDAIPDALGPVPLGLFKAQFVEEFVTGVPAYLDATWQGDRGFDPFALVALADPGSPDELMGLLTAEKRAAKLQAMSAEERAAAVAWMREAELKNGRLAMLAAAGWPLAELWNGADGALQATGGRAPSLFNGHLLDYWPGLLALAGGLAYVEAALPRAEGGDYGYGDYVWPLGKQFALGPNEAREYKEKEVKHARLAMMAITGMAVQEFVWGSPVIAQTPFFFGR